MASLRMYREAATALTAASTRRMLTALILPVS
jgi:hypothetical protein